MTTFVDAGGQLVSVSRDGDAIVIRVSGASSTDDHTLTVAEARRSLQTGEATLKQDRTAWQVADRLTAHPADVGNYVAELSKILQD